MAQHDGRENVTVKIDGGGCVAGDESTGDYYGPHDTKGRGTGKRKGHIIGMGKDKGKDMCRGKGVKDAKETDARRQRHAQGVTLSNWLPVKF